MAFINNMIPNMWVPEGIEPITIENSIWGIGILQ